MIDPAPLSAYGIIFADGSYFGRFSASETVADELRKFAEREAAWRARNPDCPDTERVPYHLGPLPCRVVPIRITPR